MGERDESQSQKGFAGVRVDAIGCKLFGAYDAKMEIPAKHIAAEEQFAVSS